MGIFEVIVLLAASPVIAFLAYGAWKFSAEPETDTNTRSKLSSR